MPPAIQQIKCPRNPDHGVVTKRWLAPGERQVLDEWKGDVFEIDCTFCGKYEYRDDPLAASRTNK